MVKLARQLAGHLGWAGLAGCLVPGLRAGMAGVDGWLAGWASWAGLGCLAGWLAGWYLDCVLKWLGWMAG